MSLNKFPYPLDCWGFPRVSGDEPEDTMTTTITATFSPRERG